MTRSGQLAPEDEATLEAVARENLLGVRFAGASLAVTALLLGTVPLGNTVSRANRGDPWNEAALLGGAACLVLGAVGVGLYLRGRRPRRAALYRLLTTDAARIRSLRFLGLVNHPNSHVYLGTEDGRERIISFPGRAEQARAFFCRLYPKAQVGTFPDRRKPAPSKYDS